MLTTWNLKTNCDYYSSPIYLRFWYTKLPQSQIAKQNNFICGFGIPATVIANFVCGYGTFAVMVHLRLWYISLFS